MNQYVGTEQGFAKIVSQSGNNMEVVMLRTSILETIPRSHLLELDEGQMAAAALEERIFVRSAGKYADYDRARMNADSERQKLTALVAALTETIYKLGADIFKAEQDTLTAWNEEKAYLEAEGKRVWELLGKPTGKGEKSVAAGCVTMRTTAARITHFDEAAALVWVKANRPDLVLTAESPDKKGLADLVERGVEIPSTVIVVEDVTTAIVKADQLVKLA